MAELSIWGEVKLPSFDTPYMARDFGLDITVPDGGLVSSAANQKQLKAECGQIYKEFSVTMGDYFQEEEELKQHLKKIHSQKKTGNRVGNTPRKDGTLSESMSGFFGIGNARRGGFVTKALRPQTVGMFAKRQPGSLPPQHERPSTVAEYTKGGQLRKRNSLSRRRSSSNMSTASATYEGVIDMHTQHTRERMLKMNSNAYSKLLSGEVSINVRHKGMFVLKQVAVESKPMSAGSRDIRRAVEMKDKTAIVRQKTNYKSPTLSSDLKINNLVAIQKSLMGLPSKRVTVGEIMEKAKDRRSRIFRVELDGSQDKHGGLYNTSSKQNGPGIDDGLLDNEGNDGIKLVKVEIRNRRSFSGVSKSQHREDMKSHAGSILRSARGTSSRELSSKLKNKRYMYLDTGDKHGDDDLDSDQSEKGTPRKVTARDVMILVKQAQEDDNERERHLSKWRQRMNFVAVKRSQLARILARASSRVLR